MTYVWPDLSIDRKAADQAFEELGYEVPFTQVIQRAQEIKDQMKTAGSDWERFLKSEDDARAKDWDDMDAEQYWEDR